MFSLALFLPCSKAQSGFFFSLHTWMQNFTATGQGFIINFDYFWTEHDLFKSDGLHLNRKWSERFKTILIISLLLPCTRCFPVITLSLTVQVLLSLSVCTVSASGPLIPHSSFAAAKLFHHTSFII